MQNIIRSTVVAVVLACTALIGFVACEQSDATPPVEEEPVAKENMPPTDYEVPITFGVERWQEIKKLDIHSGQTVKFLAKDAHVWILIPDGNLEYVWGNGKPCVMPGFIAFEIDKGAAVIKVAEDYPHEMREIRYSVLAKDGDTWDYVHGANPPPGMTIRNN
jgi:hypothetical protein